MRTLLAALYAVVAVSVATSADDPPKEKTRSEKLTDLQKAMSADQQKAVKEYEGAVGEKAKKAAEDKFMGIAPAYAQKLYKLAEEDPKDAVGFDAAMMAVQLGQSNSSSKKAMDLILSYHLENPKLAATVSRLGNFGDVGITGLKTLSEKAKDKDVKGQACYFLGAAMIENADYPRAGKPLSAEEQRAQFKDAEAILTRAAKEFGEVNVRTGTVAEEVKGQMYFLNNLTVGRTMPDAESEDLDGKKVKISDYRGKVVVLDIWATWCGPCKAMIPHEREMTGRLKDKPFTLISLSADDKKETLTKFLDTEPMPWTHWWNGGARGGAVEAYRVRFFPTVYVLDAKGVIRHKHLRGDDLEKAVGKLLVEIAGKGE